MLVRNPSRLFTLWIAQRTQAAFNQQYSMSTTTTYDWTPLPCRKVSKPYTLNAAESVTIVDSTTNQVIGKADRAVMRAFNLPHRATYIVIKNSRNGKWLVQKRTMSKDYCPGACDAMSGGVVAFDESYLENAQREAYEEMGVPMTTTTTTMRYVGEFHYEDARTNVWGGILECEMEIDQLVIQEEEVDEVYEMSVEEILAHQNRFTPDSIVAIDFYRQFNSAA